MKRARRWVVAGAVMAVLTAVEAAVSPTSYGEAARVDIPILRVPFARKAPVIDGAMEEGEWEDAAALSGFWYDHQAGHFRFLAPHQTQLQLYAAYDREHLFLAYVSPVYPENSWLKARGRFPDVVGHPLYGLIWDDHIELELRPVEDNAEGFNRGLFKWFINPINAVADQLWSVKDGEGKEWQSSALVRSGVDGKRWILEIAIPLRSFLAGAYSETRPEGRPVVVLPPPDGTAWRAWFTRGIGGNATFYNAFDMHIWNTTKTKLIFDSQSPVFQINELGPIMDDTIDLQVTVKNHNTRSETVRVGFFVESEEGLIYSSYDAPELKEGLLELKPGEVRKLRLRKAFPGISTDGNVLWFDVRSAGRPAKILFLTRLIRFHSMEGGAVRIGEQTVSFRERRLNPIRELRPPRQDFDFRFDLSAYHKRVAAVVDIGIHGASEEAKRAREAKLEIRKTDGDHAIVAEGRAPFSGSFATLLLDVPNLVDGESYSWTVLLFDANKRIVGERTSEEPFVFEIPEWLNNRVGLKDIVWEPFVPIRLTERGFETLNHIVTVDDSGLPAQIVIKPDPRELPLEIRGTGAAPDVSTLWRIGRGPQLQAPFRLEVVGADGTRLPATVVEPARLVRQWKSELEYASRLRAGSLEIGLQVQYDCDGAMHVRLNYGASTPTQVQRLEFLMTTDALTDLAVSAIHGGGMAGADRWECELSDRPGIVWDSAMIERAELFYSRFVPWLWFGNADRGFSWYADSDRGWGLDKDGSAMTLERGTNGAVTMRVAFINHPVSVGPEKEIIFTILTHPAKPKPAKHRWIAWRHMGFWADEYFGGHLLKSDDVLIEKARMMAQTLSGLAKDAPVEEVLKWAKEDPPFWRFYQCRSHVAREDNRRLQIREMNRRFSDAFTWFFERHIRIGRRHGWWWDETWPAYRSHNVAEGDAYFRDPASVAENELPWQDGYLTGHTRMTLKRLARAFRQNGVPLRNYFWANNAATAFESFGWDTMMVEECGSEHRSFELDTLTVFPNSLQRYMAHRFTGLIGRLVPGVVIAQAGDEKRFDRQLIGRALLHDIGLNSSGPHGRLAHAEQGMRVLHLLHTFGYFEDEGLEVIPYWQPDPPVVAGDGASGVRVTVYRRAREGGKGYQFLLVLLHDAPAGDRELPIVIRRPERLVGTGHPILTVKAILARQAVAPGLAEWWRTVTAGASDDPALMDLETGEAIPAMAGDALAFGPVWVPFHDYRLLYFESGANE